MSEEVEESEGVMYSDEEARWKESRLLQRQEMLLMPVPGRAGLLARSAGAWFGFAAVRSQWRFMKIGMSENALKRWVLIWALGWIRIGLVDRGVGCIVPGQFDSGY